METPPAKRKFLGGAPGPNKAPKLGAGGGGKMSFAQKMMAKMGYVDGQGLGKEGEGMVNPIEVKLRPQGAGVGAVKEKTQQYKDEQRRAAEQRGERYHDSSEEEKRARKERKKKAHGGGMSASGGSTPAGASRPKTKYRTVADVQAAAPGLAVPPQMLSSIIDATGSETKLLTSAAGLMSSGGLLSESEADKVAKRERLELEAFIEAWHGLQEQKLHIDEYAGQHQIELEQKKSDLEKLQTIADAVADLKITHIAEATSGDNHNHNNNNNHNNNTDILAGWLTIVSKLETLQAEHLHDVDRYGLSEAAIAALHPAFKKQMAGWEPLKEPALLVPELDRIGPILGLNTQDKVAAMGSRNVHIEYGTLKKRKATSSYETMIYSIWLPKVRTAVTNWDVLDPASLTSLVHAWRPLLPPFVYSNLIDQLVVPKLASSLHVWDPRKRSHHHKHVSLKYTQPHTWLFPWLPYLPPYQMDPRSPTGLLADVKRRFKQVLDGWDVGTGVLAGLLDWRELLRSELDHVLVRHLLPKLARHLSQNFEVDPADQDLTPLESIFKWTRHFKTEIFARLLVAEYFPKMLTTLHVWLTNSEAKFDEIGEWLAWWKQQIPEKIAMHPDVEGEWQKANKMINDAVDLQDEGIAMTELPAPAAGPARPIAKQLDKKLDELNATTLRYLPGEEIVQSFQDIVENWCAEEDLTMLPMREANPANGAPLFRITASATGKGGVVVFFQGDLIWGQKKGDRTAYEPLSLDEKLVRRAEGK